MGFATLVNLLGVCHWEFVGRGSPFSSFFTSFFLSRISFQPFPSLCSKYSFVHISNFLASHISFQDCANRLYRRLIGWFWGTRTLCGLLACRRGMEGRRWELPNICLYILVRWSRGFWKWIWGRRVNDDMLMCHYFVMLGPFLQGRI